MKTIAITAGALALATAMPASAAVIVVNAFANSSTGGTGVLVGPVTAGQSIFIGSSTDDLWSAGALPRFSDANGLTGNRFATPTDDSGQPVGTQIGGNFGGYTQGGLTAPYGSLVGLIGGTYQLLGANYNGTAWGTGNLELFYWDSNFGDNTGEITFNVRLGSGAVPEPSAWALLILGFGVTGAALRSSRKTRAALKLA